MRWRAPPPRWPRCGHAGAALPPQRRRRRSGAQAVHRCVEQERIHLEGRLRQGGEAGAPAQIRSASKGEVRLGQRDTREPRRHPLALEARADGRGAPRLPERRCQSSTPNLTHCARVCRMSLYLDQKLGLPPASSCRRRRIWTWSTSRPTDSMTRGAISLASLKTSLRLVSQCRR